MAPILDKQVLLDFQQGKHAAFQRVFEAYYPRLFDFAVQLIEHSDEAEDIVIVVFRKLFEKAAGFSTEENLRAYLYVSVRNRCLGYIRQRRSMSDHQKKLVKLIQNDTSFVYEYEIRDVIYNKVQAAIDQLPEECRRIFKMLYIDELKPAEVAEILHISTSTVYNQKQNALKALRLHLRENTLEIAWFLFVLLAAQKARICALTI
ncbi:RNA polymerase sigma factor [Longitalea arenae]|uniref:RNA polymerase sigma factor n=1 Tax=Longitalea arenae TaxID=2812558 RepID=UPI0019675E4E|nr:RNA polymerase sigma-70 factor [Longitalea arenae]